MGEELRPERQVGVVRLRLWPRGPGRLPGGLRADLAPDGDGEADGRGGLRDHRGGTVNELGPPPDF